MKSSKRNLSASNWVKIIFFQLRRSYSSKSPVSYKSPKGVWMKIFPPSALAELSGGVKRRTIVCKLRIFGESNINIGFTVSY